MTFTVADVVAHHSTTTAKRNARQDAKLKEAVSEVLDRAMQTANAGHISFDERLTAIKAMSSPAATAPAAPAALPSSPGKSQEQLALETLLNSSDPRITEGLKNLVKRAFSNATDPTHINVERDGTPSELAALRADHKRTTDELANERDDSVTGSLAQRLADASAASSGTAGASLSDASVTHLKAVKQALADLKPKTTAWSDNTLRIKTVFRDDLVQQLDTVIHEVEPTTT